jgi:hypothetical protein
VVQSLVDDDMVHQEKIGISNFFWAFPSEASVKVRAQISNVIRYGTPVRLVYART